jgi:predicted Zn-dependent protease
VKGADLLALANRALERAGEAEAEVVVSMTERGFARFAVGDLGQHMQLSEPEVRVRVARGRAKDQVAQASTSRLDEEAIVLALRSAAEAAERVPPTEGFRGFTRADEPVGATPPRFAESTAKTTADERAERVAKVLDAIAQEGLVAAGALETRTSSIGVATTHGRSVAHDGTFAGFKVWALETGGAGGSAGYGGAAHRDIEALDLAAETERAIRICKLGRAARALGEGLYDVVLEPPAAAELVEWLATIAFGADAVEQGTSALRGRIGERITGEGVTMTESPLEDGPFGLAAPFDREGVWRQRVPLIERGVARGVLYDRATASRAGASSTGSALMSDGGGEGAVGASAIHVDAGSAASVDELIQGMDRGLYVCRLHYVNGLLDPRRAVMTGLTRDGCFLVEKGKITAPVGNMRFTDSFLEGLERCDGMTRERTAVPTAWSDRGAHVVPAMRIRQFRFNGAGRAAR